MNLFFVASIVVFIPIVLAIFLARGMALLDSAVANSQASLENEKNSVNPRVTAGHEIPLNVDLETQLKVARRLAARQAAQKPRGANMRIGPRGNDKTRTAQDGVKEDPLTAVRIAAFHGWQGALQGANVAARPAAAPAAARQGAAPAQPAQRELKPGVDYQVIEITDEMSPGEVRQARIANAKAKSAALKAQKEAGAPAMAEPAAAAPAPAAQPAPSAEQTAAAAGIAAPDLIEITDDMSPAEVRQARIANAKAEAAYKKALKEAGVEPGAATAQAAAAEPAPAAAAAAELAPTAVADFPPPDLIAITDDMSPAEVRQARIANAKAEAAYKKALKEAGIDPSTVSL